MVSRTAPSIGLLESSPILKSESRPERIARALKDFPSFSFSNQVKQIVFHFIQDRNHLDSRVTQR